MNSRRKLSLSQLLLIVIALGVFQVTAYAQFTVTVTGTTPGGFPIANGARDPAPSDPFVVKATVTPLSGITKVVFYRNDVPYFTDTNWPFQIEYYQQDSLGEDTYTYHARAFHSDGNAVDSNDYKRTFYTRQIIRMGDPNAPVTTQLPGRDVDHTTGIQDAVTWLGDNDGGTLFFPCTIPGNDLIAIYNIKSMIYVPANVTLQGESAEEGGRCRIYWNDVSYQAPWGCAKQGPSSLNNAAMFKIVGGTSRVRFRDLLLMSRTTGPGCDNRADFDVIAQENTAAVEMNTDDEKGVGDITDIIFDNVTITHFKRAVKAVSDNESWEEYEISGIKIRAFHPTGNTVAIFIDAKYAYNWDIQNFNPGAINRGQGAVEIVNAGRPSVIQGETTNIKFLQLNCNGERADPRPFCVKVKKHGGLYFRQLHHEGVDKAIIVEDITSLYPNNINYDPIIFESSVASGEFNDASMQLYLIGNSVTAAPEFAQTGLDDSRMRFRGSGFYSTVVDCGDIHWDITDVNDGDPHWEDLKMLFTHSERYRSSFFADIGGASYIKPHTYCPANIAEFGGEFFDSGTLPNEPGLYSNELNYSNCPAGCNVADKIEWLFTLGGSVYINGTFTVYRAVNIPRGSQIIGAPNAELILAAPDRPLLLLDVKILTADNQYRLSGVVIRDLKLSTTQANSTGIAFIGEIDPNPPEEGPRPGVASDIHFSGLTFDGFTRGLYVAPAPGQGNPMIDGASFKNMTFINNTTAALNTSQNSSNWNVMNLNIQSSSSVGVGWNQNYGGHQGLQDVTCTGTTSPMVDCIRVAMVGGFYLNGLRQTTNVTNALTVGENGTVNEGIYLARHPASMVLRNSDFTSTEEDSGRMNVIGKAFITSMNNKYQDINVESANEGNVSRLTYCGDNYTGGGGAYPGLAETHTNLWVGVPTPTRVQCGPNPMAYEEGVRWTNTWQDNHVGTPLVGNFFDDTVEDFVVFREPPGTKFLIQQQGGPGRTTIELPPLANGTPLVGRFFPNSRAQAVLFGNGQWSVYDPNNGGNNTAWSWGLAGDIPFVGNFFNESGPVSGNKDEIAIYRPSTKTFWIANPRSWVYFAFTTSTIPEDSKIQVADFLGNGHDQIAQYKDGVWNIIDPQGGATYTVNFGEECDELGLPCDIPVAARYLPQLPGKDPCAQVGIWRPSTQQFIVADPFSNCGTRGTISPISMVWGFKTHGYHDIPLTINTLNSPLRRPTAYRWSKGLYDHSLSDGQWWVHDLF